MFPDEIWRECFKDASKDELKVLSSLSRRFASIFQPLLFSEPFKTWPLPYYAGPYEEQQHLLRDFFSGIACGANPDLWKDYIATLQRTIRRVELIRSNPRLADSVRKCTITGRDFHPAFYDYQLDGPSLERTIIRRYAEAVDSLFRACKHQFFYLRCMSLEGVAIDRLALDVISDLPKLEELELKNCPVLPFLDPQPLRAQSLANFTVRSDAERAYLPKKLRMYEHRVTNWLNLLGQPRLSFAEQIIVIFPNCITALFTSLPMSEVEAMALVAVLRNSATLRILELLVQPPDRLRGISSGNDEADFPVPSMASSVVPHLEDLKAPIEWALTLVPGRPIHSLKVYRSKNKTYDSEREGSLAILRGLSMSTARIRTLAITRLGKDFQFQPLQAIVEFFPHITTLAFSVLDVGAEDDRPFTTRRPSRMPDRSEAIWGLFEIPNLEDLEYGVFQVEADVEEDLASSHDESYRKPIDSTEPTVTSTYRWGIEELRSIPDNVKILTAPNTFSAPVAQGVLYHAATLPQQYPLPAGIQELHVYQDDSQGRMLPETDFDFHEQRVVVEMLGRRYPRLRTVVFRRECRHVFPSMWKLCGKDWELRDCPDRELFLSPGT